MSLQRDDVNTDADDGAGFPATCCLCSCRTGLLSLLALRSPHLASSCTHLAAIHKAAIFEPPLSINGSAPIAWLTRYDKEMAKGKVASALVTGITRSADGATGIRHHAPLAAHEHGDDTRG